MTEPDDKIKDDIVSDAKDRAELADYQSDAPARENAVEQAIEPNAGEAPAIEASESAEEPAEEASEFDGFIDPDGAKEDAAAEREGKKRKKEERSDAEREERRTFAEEIIKITVKAAAIAASLVVLILSILTVAMPLSAMRVFNKLGMDERALSSGERYIRVRLDDADASSADGIGNYKKASELGSLNDADMREALGVCINLSNSLMKSTDGGDAKYFARTLDKNIRIYLSLNGISAVNSKKSASDMESVAPQLRPFVYNYAHTLYTLDFAARIVSGDTDYMLYSSNINGNIVTTTIERSQTYAGLLIGGASKTNLMNALDGFVDYVDQISAYLAALQNRLGVNGLLTELERDQNLVRNKLKGDEIELIITPEDGFTPVLTNLLYGITKFTDYAQAAADFAPTSLDERLHQLYWLRILTTASDRIQNLGRILYYNTSVYGVYAATIRDMYSAGHFDYARLVNFNGHDDAISIAYNTLMERYLSYYSE